MQTLAGGKVGRDLTLGPCRDLRACPTVSLSPTVRHTGQESEG